MPRITLRIIVAVSIVVFGLFDVFVAANDWRPLGEMGMRLPRSHIAVSLDGRHSCAVIGDGSVRCWGANDFGQLGSGAVSSGATPTPATVSGITTAIAVSIGRDHSCALLVTGRVQCWGANASGQLGNGTTTPSAVPVQVSDLTDAVTLSSGSTHTCVRTATGRVRCWGSNSQGQLGNGTRVDSSVPVDADQLLDARMVTAGADHTCAIRATGEVVCWGANASGQLGVGDIARRTRPTPVNGVSDTRHLSAGRFATCATAASGDVLCWGKNATGQFGNGGTSDSLTPTPAAIEPLILQLSVSVGGEHTCSMASAFTTDGVRETEGPTFQCWGQNASGQLGLGFTGAPKTTPQLVRPFGAVMEFAAGSAHTCTLLDEERVRCWGRNDAGQLGDGSTTDSSLPTIALGLIGSVPARGLAAGLNHSCAWRTDGSAACWGRNASGQLGDGTFTDRLAPVTVPVGRRVFSMAGGDHHTCAGATIARFFCWGRNIDHQVSVAVGSPDFVTVPTSFTGRINTNLVAGSFHTMVGQATRRDANANITVGWGANASLQLGDQTDDVTGLPSAGPLDFMPTAVVTGTQHSCALLANGTVHCWGSNSFGQLGIGSLAAGPFGAPEQVLGVVDAVSIATGPFHTCVVRVNGTVQCWGRNDFRQIGDGTTTDRVFATDVPNVAPGGAVALALGRTHSCVLTASGGVRCWGRNDRGQLGDATFTDRPAPVFVRRPRLFFRGEPLLSDTVTLTEVTGIVTGQTHTCARRVSGQPFCWGNNEDGQVGDGTNTNRPVAIGVPSFTANMVPAAGISSTGRHVDVTAVLSCAAGAQFDVDIEVSQSESDGTGQTHGTCTGMLERFSVTINAHGAAPFEVGAATATAVFEVKQGTRTIDLQQWTRTLQLAIQ